MRIQIDFLDTDIAAALLPVFTMKPDLVYYFCDKRRIRTSAANHVAAAIHGRLPVTQVQFIHVKLDNMREIRSRMQKVMDESAGNEIYVDLTGGEELMIACGYIMAVEKGAVPITVDMKTEKIIHVVSGKALARVEHLKLTDYLTACGAKRLMPSHQMPLPAEYSRICAMAELLFDRTRDWENLCFFISKTASEAPGIMEFSLTDAFRRKNRRAQELLDAFVSYGFLRKGGEDRYIFPNKRARSYMTTYGIWLELYLYIRLQESFDEVSLGVVIDWNAGDEIDTVDNEIDVLVMRRSAPIFISCKMTKPAADDVYEVGYLASRLGGVMGRGVIATTFNVADTREFDMGIYQRLKKMHVGVLEAQALKGANMAQKLAAALETADNM